MAIEIVIFHLRPDVTRADFLSAVNETTALLKNQNGFVSRSVSQTESGEWVDIIHWESIEAGKAATEVFQTEPAGRRFSEYIHPEHFQVFFTEPVA